MDPCMITGIETKARGGLVSYRNILREMKKQKSQMDIKIYFHEVTLNMPASPSPPSTSSTSFASATSERARLNPPQSLPPQPTQCEENKDEDFMMIHFYLMNNK